MLYRFAGFRFDSDRHELVRPDGETTPLLGKAERLLRALLERPGVTVSHEELLALIWPDVSTTEASLRRAVHLVRQALAGGNAAQAEEDEENAVLATVRGHGYRIDVPVEVIDPHAEPHVEAPSAPRSRLRRRLVLPAVGAGLLLLLVFLGRPIAVDVAASWPEGAPIARPVTSVAVLRFDDLAEGGAQAHIAQGISEEVIHRLAQIPSLHVIGRTSSFALPPGTPIAEIGSRLGVGSVLEGSVRGDGRQLRVTAQFLRVSDEMHVFSRTFDLDTADLFAAQDEIAGQISADLAEAVEVASPARLDLRRAPNPLAYEHFLRGSTTQQFRSKDGATRTIEQFERAVALDPGFAEAWAELSRALPRFAFYLRAEPARYDAAMRRAEEAALRALALDPTSGLAHAAFAGVLGRNGDMAGAAVELRKGVELAPGYSALLEDYGMTLARLGRLEEARDLLTRLVERDPLSPLAHRQLGRLHLYLGEPEQAIRSLLRCLALNPTDEDAPRLIADAYTAQGRELEAGEMFIRRYPWALRAPARAGLRLFGIRGMARISYELMRWRSGDNCLRRPYAAAGYLAVAGEREGMFRCLEAAPPTMLTFLGLEPVFAPYRDDPRFARVLARTGMVAPGVDTAGDAGRGSVDPGG